MPFTTGDMLVATDVSVLARRRPSTLIRRFHAYALSSGRLRDRVVFATCLGISVALLVAMAVMAPQLPVVIITPVILLSGLYLPNRHLVVLYIVIALGLSIATPNMESSVSRMALALSAVFAVMVMMVIVASSRVRVGSTGFHGEDLLVELRDRIARSAHLPTLPGGWTADSAVRSANGEGFSGDFMVADRTHGGRHLEVALVDVSGKGREAGTRALLLSGALGALLGSLAPSDFLHEANRYLVRQGWDEGFATAVHLDIDLDTGAFSVGNAGHPDPVRYSAGAGTWAVLHADRGPVLGVLSGARFPRTNGTLAPGDALMIYSDGIIESRKHDLTEGTDRMLGAAADAMIRGGPSVAEAVVAQARSGEADDRAVFVIARS